MRWLLALSLLAGCNLLFPLDGSFVAGEGRRAVTIAPPTGQPLPDFPVGILIEDGTLRGVDPDNMRFVGGDGMELHSELLFDDERGDLEAWVRIPLLQDEITISFEWGGATEHATDPRLVWGEGDAPKFAGVWHLSEREGPGRDSSSDPTGPHNVLDIAGSEAASIPGIFGGARLFRGLDAMCSGTSKDQFQFGTETFSFGVWVNTMPTTTDFDAPLTKGGGNDGNPGFNFELGEDGWAANVCCDSQDIRDHKVAATEAIDREWVHLLAVVDPQASPRGTLQLFVGTTMVAVSELAPANFVWNGASSDDELCIGGKDFANETQFHGAIDEVRVYRGLIPGEWLTTETYNFTDREEFVQLGDPNPL